MAVEFIYHMCGITDHITATCIPDAVLARNHRVLCTTLSSRRRRLSSIISIGVVCQTEWSEDGEGLKNGDRRMNTERPWRSWWNDKILFTTWRRRTENKERRVKRRHEAVFHDVQGHSTNDPRVSWRQHPA